MSPLEFVVDNHFLGRGDKLWPQNFQQDPVGIYFIENFFWCGKPVSENPENFLRPCPGINPYPVLDHALGFTGQIRFVQDLKNVRAQPGTVVFSETVPSGIINEIKCQDFLSGQILSIPYVGFLGHPFNLACCRNHVH